MSELRSEIMKALIGFPPETVTEAEQIVDRVIALIQKEQGWRDMSEAPLGDLILVRTDRGTYHTAYHDDYSGGTWWIAGTTVSVEPTDWQPLPTPPQGEDG